MDVPYSMPTGTYTIGELTGSKATLAIDLVRGHIHGIEISTNTMILGQQNQFSRAWYLYCPPYQNVLYTTSAIRPLLTFSSISIVKSV